MRDVIFILLTLAIFAVFGIFSRIPAGAAMRPFLGLGGISLEIYATHIYFVALAVSLTAPLGATGRCMLLRLPFG